MVLDAYFYVESSTDALSVLSSAADVVAATKLWIEIPLARAEARGDLLEVEAARNAIAFLDELCGALNIENDLAQLRETPEGAELLSEITGAVQ